MRWTKGSWKFSKIVATLAFCVVVVLMIRLTQTSYGAYNESPSDKLDLLMKKTGTETYHSKLGKKDMYPLMIITDGGGTFKFKEKESDTVRQFSNTDGLMPIFNWSKGVCHLTVWSHQLLAMYTNDKNSDWRSNAQMQRKNIKETIANLPNIKSMLDSVNNKKVATSSTDDFPVKLVASTSAYVSYAKRVLAGTDKFIGKILQKNSVTVGDIQDLMDNIIDSASWLFNATIYPLQDRTIKTLKLWQCGVSKSRWDDLRVVLASGMPAQGGVGQTRGNCMTGGTAEASLRLFMTESRWKSHVMIVPSNDISFDNADDIVPEIIVAQKIVKNSSNSKNSQYSKLLFKALMNPSNALAIGFAEEVNDIVNKEKFTCPNDCVWASDCNCCGDAYLS